MGEWGEGGVYDTYLPLRGMTVEARLGSAVSPALPVVNIEVKLEVDHFSAKLDESAGVIVHRTRRVKKGMWSGGEGGVCVVGDGMRRNEGDEPSAYKKFIANTKNRKSSQGALKSVREEQGRFNKISHTNRAENPETNYFFILILFFVNFLNHI